MSAPTHSAHAAPQGFIRRYVFSLDHKVIGIQYAITGMLFLLFGFTLMMLMRFQLAFPGRPIPVIGNSQLTASNLNIPISFGIGCASARQGTLTVTINTSDARGNRGTQSVSVAVR